MQSFMINIIDDNIVECVESFSVVMTSVTTCGVTIADINNSSEVVITDDDSKFIRHESAWFTVIAFQNVSVGLFVHIFF